jgi:hypothetical protein
MREIRMSGLMSGEGKRSMLQRVTAPFLDSTDGVNQAAALASGATSIPSRNVTPLTTFGN